MTVSIADIKALAAQEYGTTVTEIDSRRRGDDVREARHVAIYLARLLTGRSTPALGRAFDRDPSSIWAALARMERRVAEDPDLATRVQRLIEILSGDPAQVADLAAAALAGSTIRAATQAAVADIVAALARDPMGTLARLHAAALAGGPDHG